MQILRGLQRNKMSKKSFNEVRENRNHLNVDGLKQKRLKEENRWRFNSNYNIEEDDYEEESEYDSYEFQGIDKKVS